VNQVFTDRIDAQIERLLIEAESYREQERRLAGDPRSGGMAAHFAMRERVFAIGILENLLKDGADDGTDAS
jgi:hypothetical protein